MRSRSVRLLAILQCSGLVDRSSPCRVQVELLRWRPLLDCLTVCKLFVPARPLFWSANGYNWCSGTQEQLRRTAASLTHTAWSACLQIDLANLSIVLSIILRTGAESLSVARTWQNAHCRYQNVILEDGSSRRNTVRGKISEAAGSRWPFIDQTE